MTKDELDISLKDILKDIAWSTAFKSIDLIANVRGDRCVVICDFYTEIRERAIKLINLNEPNLISEIKDWVKYIENAVIAIQRLNDIESKFEEANSYYTKIVYRWGDSREFCSISDWDYNRIELKLSRDSIKRLISFELTLDDIVKSEDKHSYDDIVNYIKNINNREVNKAIGIKLKTDNIMEELMSNKLSFKDVKKVINTNIKGEQLINSAVTIRDLDLIGIYYININYTTRTISIELSEDKILDIENERFIRDEVLAQGLVNTMKSKLKQILNWV